MDGTFYKPVKFRYVQRDSRTPLNLKRGYVFLSLFTCAFSIIIAIYMWVLYANFAQNNPVGVFFVVLAMVLSVFAIILFVVNMFAALNENYMWMKALPTGGECIGPDVEDCNPYVLKRNAQVLETRMDALQEITDADISAALMYA